MKNPIEVSGIKPVRDNILVQMTKIPNGNDSGVFGMEREAFTGDTPINYMGKIVKTGPDVKEVEVGDYVLFSMLSGLKILTKDPVGKKTLSMHYKIIEETSLLVRSKMSGMMIKNLKTVNDIMIVDVKEVKEVKTGVVVADGSVENDPRERAMERGIITQISKEGLAAGYNIGDAVYFGTGMGILIEEIKGDGIYKAIRPMYVMLTY